MEAKINIAEILKDKPKRIKLYADAFGELEYCDISDDKDPRIFVEAKECTSYVFYNNGKYNKYGEPILFPSKVMRDRSKFSWKKGDVLQHTEYPLTVIFESFEDDTYTSFKCKYNFNFESSKWLVSNSQCSTKHFYKVSEDEAKEFIKKVELNYNGKLNMEILEIEPAQPEFKDGDFVCYTSLDGDKCIGIVKETENDAIVFHVKYDLWMHNMEFNVSILKENHEFCKSNDLGDEIALNEALHIRNQSWDAEKKQIVDFKTKVELKPFDKVLCRDEIDEEWHIDLFESMQTINKYNYKCVANIWKFCIPYKGNEHLLGTTKDVEE